MCLTCDVVNRKIVPIGGILYQDDLAVAHQCLDVYIPGYFIVFPIRHVEKYSSLTDSEIFRISLVVKSVVQILNELHNVEKVYILNFAEETVYFHWHIFPRYTWMLTQNAEHIYTGNRVDGAKLFSFWREKYKERLADRDKTDILKIIDIVRNRLCQSICL